MLKQLCILLTISQLSYGAFSPNPDPECTTGVIKVGSLGTACCTDDCDGICGSALGNACSQRPGGGEECCYGGQGNGGIFDGTRYCDTVGPPCIVRYDPYCVNDLTGIYKESSPTNGPVRRACCPAGCGACGEATGTTCSERPGGASSCCFNAVADSGLSCVDNSPPCVPLEP